MEPRECSHCGEEILASERLCAACRSIQDRVPYAVDAAFRRLEGDIDDTIGKWQNRGWDTGAVSDAIRERINDLLEAL